MFQNDVQIAENFVKPLDLHEGFNQPKDGVREVDVVARKIQLAAEVINVSKVIVKNFVFCLFKK